MRKDKNKKRFFSTFIKALLVILILGGGLLLMAYPYVANYVFEHRKDSIIYTYEKQAESVLEKEQNRLIKEAQDYNVTLFTGHIQLNDPFSSDANIDDVGDYDSKLSIDGSDIIGYINIPCIDVSLPIYHGTSEEVLLKGVGHIKGTSLPVGGENTHCVLTGHTGLSNAKMFTDLTELEKDDIFVLDILNHKLAYKVDQIKVVEPYEMSDLTIEPGEDYCTLITCTPYGINSHRLLVRGTRIEYTEKIEDIEVTKRSEQNSEWMKHYKASLLLALGIIAIVLIPVIICKYRRRKKDEKSI